MSFDMSLSRKVLVLGSALATLSHSVGAQGPGRQTTVRDSSGVRLVIHRAVRDAIPRIRVDSLPFLDLGGLRSNVDEEIEAQPWLSAVRLESGALVVNELTRLKWFSSTGRLVRSAGRAGDGPGEFRHIREVCRLRGDSLLAIEYATGRLSLWDSSGVYVRSFPRPGFVPFRACYPDGTVIAQVPTTGSSADGDASGAPYARMRPDGTILTSLGRLPAPRYAGTIAFEVSIEPLGEYIYVADARRYEVQVLDQAGRLRWLLRNADAARQITDAEWRRQAESSVPSSVQGERRDRQIAMMMSMERPASWPAFRYVRVDPAHRIWVGDYHDGRVWTVFSATGELLGQLELPWPSEADPQLVGLTADYMIVRRSDADGAPHLSFHRVRIAP